MIPIPCHSWREIPNGAAEGFCAHPQVHATDQIVSAAICSACEYREQPPPAQFRAFDPAGIGLRRTGPCFFLGDQTDWRECATCGGHVRIKVFQCRHVSHDQTTYDACRQCADFENPLPRGTVRHWEVGMTTAPRAEPTLERTLASLADAGWRELRLFAEPDSVIPDAFAYLPVSWREGRLGAFPNWLLALNELYLREPKADAYFLCQDDVIFSRGLRNYLERELWPEERLGAVSVYSAGSFSQQPASGFVRDDRGNDVGGALALIFPNSALRAFLGDPHVLNHRRKGAGMHFIDSVVGRWSTRCGLPLLVHVPSLAQHVGETSTLFPGAGNSANRHAGRFIEQLADF